ncbi:MAG: PilZ domain-containing protein [Pseudolabrys sp.]
MQMQDRRSAPRHRTFKGGSISFDLFAGIECVVRNLSETGACIEMDCPGSLPQDFSLVIKPENTRRACHLVWRTDNRLGVRFS